MFIVLCCLVEFFGCEHIPHHPVLQAPKQGFTEELQAFYNTVTIGFFCFTQLWFFAIFAYDVYTPAL
jgi:hypothetical protein